MPQNRRYLLGTLAVGVVLVLSGAPGCGDSSEDENPKAGTGGKAGTGSGGTNGTASGGFHTGGTGGTGTGGTGTGGSTTGGTGGSSTGGSDGSAGGIGTGGSNTGGTGGTGGSGGSDGSAGGIGTGGSSGTAGAGGMDGSTDASEDGSSDAASDSGPTCTVGEVQSDATASNLSLFGTPVYFDGGNSIPPGTYEVRYVDGCMKYSANQGWTVNAYDGGCCSWWLVGETTADQKLVLPGTIGYAAGSGAFANFDECVAASSAAAPKIFAHTGGKLAIWLQDSPYTDNLAGVSGRNPRWRLTRLGACVDGGGSDASGS